MQTKDPGGIDAEVFIDDDGQAYVFWGRRHVAKLAKDMITVDSVVHVISTPRKEYSEGPIFFKRKGIYYYLYTIGGDEKYQYAYVMSKVSPLGPSNTRSRTLCRLQITNKVSSGRDMVVFSIRTKTIIILIFGVRPPQYQPANLCKSLGVQ